MNIRNVRSSDHKLIIQVLNDWWNGRQMADMLPKLFFDHFQDTSYIVEDNGEVIGFLIGFISQSRSKEAYIHFVGVHPQYREHGVGRRLYETFFNAVKIRGVENIRCVTSPVNKSSIAYHKKMGFVIEKGDKIVDGVDVHLDYDGKGGDRVLFMKRL
ncbi:GNAT family N-acetyltransferase [Paenibacillus donghaensis]|uniref:GNAT family N-acetyltransferase n=1 Tax=Paenibacillus donghaensis TaxID=414771 RepID=UPI001883426B|nr:GNAT family N-acetyltransferase [Paenibacillus donghaensis]MBE9914195.1 GNAT family N-acetyltransferase [Paenibacillus donghaensis]